MSIGYQYLKIKSFTRLIIWPGIGARRSFSQRPGSENDCRPPILTWGPGIGARRSSFADLDRWANDSRVPVPTTVCLREMGQVHRAIQVSGRVQMRDREGVLMGGWVPVPVVAHDRSHLVVFTPSSLTIVYKMINIAEAVHFLLMRWQDLPMDQDFLLLPNLKQV